MSPRVHTEKSAFPAVPGGPSLNFGLADYIGAGPAADIQQMNAQLKLAEQALKNPAPDTLSLQNAPKLADPVVAEGLAAQALQRAPGALGPSGPGSGQPTGQPGGIPGIGQLLQDDAGQPMNPVVMPGIVGASVLGGVGMAKGMELLFRESGDTAAPIVRAAKRLDSWAPSKWANKHLSTGHGQLAKTRFAPQLNIASGKTVGVDVVKEHTEQIYDEMLKRFGKPSEGVLTKAFKPVRDAIKTGDTTQALNEFEALGKNMINGPQRQELLNLGKGSWRTKATLRNFSNSIRGRHSSLTMGQPMEQLIISAEKMKMGPIGKMFLTVTGLLKRAVSAESITDKGIFKNMGSLIGPALGGGMLFGFAFWDSHKAKKGDKVKSFFHNFLGIGLGGLVGFELAEMLFKRTNLISKLLPGIGSRIGLPFLAGPTLGGLAVFLIAQTIFFKPFAKIGESISDRIFGTPEKVKEERLKKKGIRTETPETFNPTGESLQLPDVFKQFEAAAASAPASAATVTPSPTPAQMSAQQGPTPAEIRESKVRKAQNRINDSAYNGDPNFEVPLTDLNKYLAGASGGH